MKVLSLTVALLALVAVIECGIVLTGHADIDFSPSNPSFKSNELGALGKLDSETDFYYDPGTYMNTNNKIDGFDVETIRVFYDSAKDSLYVGIQCKGVCGDSDGNLNPDTLDPAILVTQPTYKDDANGCNSETYSLLWWNNIPSDFDLNNGDNSYFFPQFITGDSAAACITNGANQLFNAYEFPDYKTVKYVKGNQDDPAVIAHSNIVSQAGSLGYSGARVSASKGVPGLRLYSTRTNASAPHFEFELASFSKYPGNEYLVPGSGYLRLALSGLFYDAVRYDYVYPKIFQIIYDCEGIPNGGKVYDSCGVCGGDNSKCLDCNGQPNWNGAKYDACGVCGGDGSQCLCSDYLGFELDTVDYALLRWTVDASISKINDTLSVLKNIRSSLHDYDYQNRDVALNTYIDIIHEFCDECLNDFDDAQLWFTEIISGACDGLKCDSPFEVEPRWTL